MSHIEISRTVGYPLFAPKSQQNGRPTPLRAQLTQPAEQPVFPRLGAQEDKQRVASIEAERCRTRTGGWSSARTRLWRPQSRPGGPRRCTHLPSRPPDPRAVRSGSRDPIERTPAHQFGADSPNAQGHATRGGCAPAPGETRMRSDATVRLAEARLAAKRPPPALATEPPE